MKYHKNFLLKTQLKHTPTTSTHHHKQVSVVNVAYHKVIPPAAKQEGSIPLLMRKKRGEQQKLPERRGQERFLFFIFHQAGRQGSLVQTGSCYLVKGVRDE